MRDGHFALSSKGKTSWDRVFGPKAAKHPFAYARDDEKVDVVSAGRTVETTTVGSLRERGVL